MPTIGDMLDDLFNMICWMTFSMDDEHKEQLEREKNWDDEQKELVEEMRQQIISLVNLPEGIPILKVMLDIHAIAVAACAYVTGQPVSSILAQSLEACRIAEALGALADRLEAEQN